MKYIIGIDTSRVPIRLAIRDSEGLLFQTTYRQEKMEHFPLFIQHILDLLEIPNQDLIGVGAITGPGNYTGLRAGLTWAKTMAQVLNLPLYGFNKLNVLLYGARHLKQKTSPLINIRQKQVYTTVGQYGDPIDSDTPAFQSVLLETWIAQNKIAHPDILYCGDPYDFDGEPDFPFVSIENSADLVAQLTWDAYQDNPDSHPYDILPFYIRPAVVAPKQKAGQKK